MEEKGYFVTKDGCLIPHELYSTTPSKGKSLKGHQRSSYFFTGLTNASSTALASGCAGHFDA